MDTKKISEYEKLIYDYTAREYSKLLREPEGDLTYKFIVPGSVYAKTLWDWDSWLTDIALSEIDLDTDISEYEKGCVINFAEHTAEDGAIPIEISPDSSLPRKGECDTNVHKPTLAQHAHFLCEKFNDYSWLAPHFANMEKFIGYYENNCKHESGLYFWIDDLAIGVDNDPCTFYRPKKSSASIYLNCLMYKELLAMAEIAKHLQNGAAESKYAKLAEDLKEAVRVNCFDERNGFYYSVDIDLLPIDENNWLHAGCPRHWNTLMRKIDVWSGFMAMWAGIATPVQAERMVKENYRNDAVFHAPYGVRSLAKSEKMYAIIKSGNPSCWLGPIWGIANYMTFEGLLNYGYIDDAAELCEKTTLLFGKDIENCGEMHEYYHPETGEGVNNQGFQSWNLLAVKMANDLRKVKSEKK